MIVTRWLRSILVVVLLFFSFGVSAASASTANSTPERTTPTMGLAEYKAELERWSRALESAQKNPAEIEMLRRSLPPRWSVESGGAKFEVPTSWLDLALHDMQTDPRASAVHAREAAQHLAALQREADAFAAPGRGPSLDVARGRLEAILSRREFATMSGPSALDRLLQRIGDWLARLLSKIFGHARLSRQMGNIFAWSAIVLAFVLLAIWVMRYLRRRSQQDGLNLRGAAPLPTGSRDWAKAAVAAAQRGEYREAIHCAYWAGVARLEELGALPEDRSRTPRESLRLLKPENANRVPMADLTQRFELVWYGDRPATATDWGEAASQLERIGCLLRSTPATAGS